jgi:hypothetical protein
MLSRGKGEVKDQNANLKNTDKKLKTGRKGSGDGFFPLIAFRVRMTEE